jgi:hypothetical protein
VKKTQVRGGRRKTKRRRMRLRRRRGERRGIYQQGWRKRS